jgi:predicted Zn-dependent protease with MMP-like domain
VVDSATASYNKIKMKRSEFRRIIQKALDELPPQFRAVLHNIDIQVRWRPTPQELRQFGVRPGGSLFGVYTGVSLPQRSQGYSMVLPDRIIIYQRTHEMYCRNEEEMVEQARQTLLHEIGHYLGIDERRLRELGVG